MVPKWAPGVIKTIRQITNKSYRQLGAELGVADSSVMRWENGTVRMNEQNWGVVKRYYSKLCPNANPQWNSEEFMLLLPNDGIPIPDLGLNSTTSRESLVNRAKINVYHMLRSICPGFKALVEAGLSSSDEEINPLAERHLQWHEFCFFSIDISKLTGDELWCSEAFEKMAVGIATGFRGRRSHIASAIELNADLRGATVDFKVGCLVKD